MSFSVATIIAPARRGASATSRGACGGLRAPQGTQALRSATGSAHQ
jgi:hypothetical protein